MADFKKKTIKFKRVNLITKEGDTDRSDFIQYM
jgi:hypothetical protein